MGEGDILSDYSVKFSGFNTVVGDVKLTNGKFYYEFEISKFLNYP